MKKPLSNILFIDDQPDQLRLFAKNLGTSVVVKICSPEAVTVNDLANADLVLVDYQITHWPERGLQFDDSDQLLTDVRAIGISRQPADGLALTAVLRSHLGHFHSLSKGPTAFALHSAHLADLAGNLPAQRAPQIIARANNIEWAFEKAPAGIDLSRKIISLADGIRDIGNITKNLTKAKDKDVPCLVHILGIKVRLPWFKAAWKDVINCHPPIHQATTSPETLLYARWILTRILPYPCFLYDTKYLAARLRIDIAHLTEDIENGGPISRVFKEALYSGVLSGFFGPRWWRAGVDQIIWDLTKDSETPAVRLMSKIFGKRKSIELSPIKNPVICLDSELKQHEYFSDLEKCVRIQPDDWPSYADGAWALIEEVRNSPELNALVYIVDQERVGAQ